jgi:protease I
MRNDLSGKKIAILVENGFEQEELVQPKEALEKSGAQTFIVSPSKDKVRGWNHTEWGDEFPVDRDLASTSCKEYDALLLPGGVLNPDKLRMNPEAVQFVQEFFTENKPVAAICHGPWTLINAGVVKGRMLTSWPSLSIDLKNAGANWTDQEVVVDNGLVTSRKPDDIPAFNIKMIEEFSEGVHERKTA